MRIIISYDWKFRPLRYLYWIMNHPCKKYQYHWKTPLNCREMMLGVELSRTENDDDCFLVPTTTLTNNNHYQIRIFTFKRLIPHSYLIPIFTTIIIFIIPFCSQFLSCSWVLYPANIVLLLSLIEVRSMNGKFDQFQIMGSDFVCCFLESCVEFHYHDRISCRRS